MPRTSAIPTAAAVAIAAVTFSVSFSAQQAPAGRGTPRPFSVAQNVGPNAYDVAPDWSLPYPKAGYAWGSVPGIFVESDDRILVASRGEIKLPDPLPSG
jgi:hypothetical protein